MIPHRITEVAPFWMLLSVTTGRRLLRKEGEVTGVTVRGRLDLAFQLRAGAKNTPTTWQLGVSLSAARRTRR